PAYLIALSTRFASAWLTSSRLPRTGAGAGASTVSASPFSSASGSYNSPTSRAISAASNSVMLSRVCPDSARAIIGLALGTAQRLFTAVAQPRQRRLEVVGDVVGDLLEAAHQRLDALEHGV